MRVYTVSSDPAIGAQDIRITGDEVAIVLSKEETKQLYITLTQSKPQTDSQAVVVYNLAGKLRLSGVR